MKKYLLLLLLPALAGCMSAEDKELRAALDMAGENRAELEHVLDFFASDSLKSRAARFLIANMPASYGYMPETQSELERVYQAYDSINRVYAYQTGEEWGKSIDDLSHRFSYWKIAVEKATAAEWNVPLKKSGDNLKQIYRYFSDLRKDFPRKFIFSA